MAAKETETLPRRGEARIETRPGQARAGQGRSGGVRVVSSGSGIGIGIGIGIGSGREALNACLRADESKPRGCVMGLERERKDGLGWDGSVVLVK